MGSQLIEQVTEYVENNIHKFHMSRIDKLNTLKLNTVLKKKNPYLFKAKYCLTAGDLVQGIASAFVSSAEETIFGDWMEGLAIFIAEKVYGGRKSSATGIDLELRKGTTHYVVAIKSGPNWGNSGQIAKMRTDFMRAKRVLRTSKSNIGDIQAVNGCCYGADGNPDKGDYFKYCGQDFWSFISGNDSLYLDIIAPLATSAKERNEEFQKQYTNMINKFTFEFIQNFCKNDGAIDWEKIVRFNSGRKQ